MTSRPARSTRRVAFGALAAISVASLAACSSSGSSSADRHPTVVTTAPASPTGSNATGTTATVTPPVGVPSLDGITLSTTKVADTEAPTAITARPGSTALFVAEQKGIVRRLDATGSGAGATYQVAADPVLDLSSRTTPDGERGLLGLAFAADGQHLYVHYTDADGKVTVDEYAMQGDVADPSSRRNLLSIEHPLPNHNGGQLQLGPDGFLYIGLGDGGGGGDPNRNGQNPKTLLGKVLRIDPTGRTGDKPYAIPPGNPYADGKDGAPEVWMYGLRNPWRFAFDRETQDLWVADVGQNQYEEIDFLPHTADGAGRGANLGWNRMEGTHPYNDGTPPPDHTPPIFDYSHDGGECSVTGGYVYRGPDPSWQGVYVFADYCQGEIRLLLRQPDGTVAERGTGLHLPNGDLESGGSITSFGQAGDGTLFVLSAAGGVYRLDKV